MAAKASSPVDIPAGKPKVGHQALPRDLKLSSTPGGSIFATTPGGTRIVYDRAALLNIRNSPLAKTPPAGLPTIPGITLGSPAVFGSAGGAKSLSDKNPKAKVAVDDSDEE